MGNCQDARQFVDNFFGGDATAAILAIGSACGVAVAYQDRATWEAQLGSPISDERYAGLTKYFDGYHERLEQDAPGVIGEWMDEVLAQAGTAAQAPAQVGHHLPNDDERRTETVPAKLTDAEQTEQAVCKWLLDYAWLGTKLEQAREVECILTQGDWQHLDARADRRAGASESGGGPKEYSDAMEIELSALYECHEGPHTPACPRG